MKADELSRAGGVGWRIIIGRGLGGLSLKISILLCDT